MRRMSAPSSVVCVTLKSSAMAIFHSPMKSLNSDAKPRSSTDVLGRGSKSAWGLLLCARGRPARRRQLKIDHVYCQKSTALKSASDGKIGKMCELPIADFNDFSPDLPTLFPPLP